MSENEQDPTVAPVRAVEGEGGKIVEVRNNVTGEWERVNRPVHRTPAMVIDGPDGTALLVDTKPLSRANKAELLAVAEREGLTLPDDMSNSQIIAAIEAAREAR